MMDGRIAPQNLKDQMDLPIKVPASNKVLALYSGRACKQSRIPQKSENKPLFPSF
jgi:hypothetical protein